MTDTPITYPRPMLRIQANFAATDGSCPESVEIEFTAEGALPPGFVSDVIAALAAIPGGRYLRHSSPSPSAAPKPVTPTAVTGRNEASR